MRFLVAAALSILLLPTAVFADPAGDEQRPRRGVALASRTRVGTEMHWAPGTLGRRVGVGLGWFVPQRWYDVDGALLTERALLNPGCDLERPGFYLALRF